LPAFTVLDGVFVDVG